jgi:3-oxoacyl-[acyl-carrier-protein] synthase III
MFLQSIAHYLPSTVVPNAYFAALNGLSDDWISTRTGIRERRKAGPRENTQTMAIEATRRLMAQAGNSDQAIDLIVAATYTPYDTVATLGHVVQNEIGGNHIPVVTISAACSSLLNAIEIAEGYFATQKATYALVVASEHNTAYANETDPVAGHLWGDGAVALLITREPRPQRPGMQVQALKTGGAANVGKGIQGVQLRPFDGGIIMPNGRDVFMYAVQYMTRISQEVLESLDLSVDDLRYFAPHQANLRITRKVAANLNLPEEKLLSNIQYLGNTGSAGCGIALSEAWESIKPGDRVMMTVFGGGYSYGAMLLEA